MATLTFNQKTTPQTTQGAVDAYTRGQLKDTMKSQDPWANLTNGAIHSGSWSVGPLRLPDFGISEAYASDSSTPRKEVLSNSSQINYSQVPSDFKAGGSQDNTTQKKDNSGGQWGGYGSKDAWFQALGLGQQAPAGWNGPGGGGDGNIDQEISDAYAPTLSALDDAIRMLGESADRDITDVGNRTTTQKKQVDEYGNQLLGAADSEQNKFNDTLTTALQDAIRAYNALQQQGNARFGRGNSAGGAMSELAQQEFFRQQGSVNKQQVAGDMQFAGERSKIRDHVTKQKEDLDMWSNEAITKVKNNLGTQLAELNIKKAGVHENKTKDKLNYLNTARQQVEAIKLADTQFRQGIISDALSNMQEAAGRVFTPSEIAANLAELQNLLFGTNMSTTSNSGIRTALRAVGNKEDDLQQTQV